MVVQLPCGCLVAQFAGTGEAVVLPHAASTDSRASSGQLGWLTATLWVVRYDARAL
jgi:hypothetical protein